MARRERGLLAWQRACMATPFVTVATRRSHRPLLLGVGECRVRQSKRKRERRSERSVATFQVGHLHKLINSR